MVKEEVERVAPRSRIARSERSEQPRRSRLEHNSGYAVPEAHPVALGRVVQQGRSQQLAIIVAGRQQTGRHVQAVSPVRDRHAGEERPRCRGQQRAGQGLVVAADASGQVAEELGDPMHR